MRSLHIKARIASAGVTRDAVARQAGYHPSLFSRVINGLRLPPPDFEQRVNAALDMLERAERAAAAARERILTGSER